MAKDTMRLVIADEQFTITRAILCAYVIAPEQPQSTANGSVRSGLFWFLNVEVRDEWIKFWHEDIQLPNVHRWMDIVGQGVKSTTWINAVTGEMNGGWYGGNLISGHLAILESSLRFTERDGCKVRLKWDGIANGAPLGCEPDPDERMPFVIDCWCDFDGISRAHGRDVITQFLDMSDFSETVADTPHPISGMYLFKPLC